MKAIETVYKGYKFRSRLEARWAVFFDALEIEWQYEVEGFELENGSRYLPDFYLPKVFGGSGCWVEIKPLTDKEIGKIGDEALNGEWPTEAIKMAFLLNDNSRGIIIYGMPYPGEYKISMFNSDGVPYERWFEFYVCLDCGLMTVRFSDISIGFWNRGDSRRPCYYCIHPINQEIHTWLMWAFTAARQARFEHGQSGA